MKIVRNAALALTLTLLGATAMTEPSIAQAQGAPSATSGVLVILTAKANVTREQIMAVMPSEIRETVKLYLDGKIHQWYSRSDGKGVIFLIDAKTQERRERSWKPYRSQKNSWWITNTFRSDP